MKRILILFLILTVTVFSLTGCLYRCYKLLPPEEFKEFIELGEDKAAKENYIREGNLDFAKVGSAVIVYKGDLFYPGSSIVFFAYFTSNIDSIEFKEATLMIEDNQIALERSVTGPYGEDGALKYYALNSFVPDDLNSLGFEFYDEVTVNITVSVSEGENVFEKEFSYTMSVDKSWSMLTV